MKYALVDNDGIVQNIIEYDGVSTYTPLQGHTLSQANSWIQIGDHIDTPEPTYDD